MAALVRFESYPGVSREAHSQSHIKTMTQIKLNLSGHINATLEAQGFIFPGSLQVDLADKNLPKKIVEFLSQYMTSGDVVICVLPGLAPLAAITLCAIHGITGTFPVMITLVRGEEGFEPNGEGLNLQDFRNNVARSKGRSVIAL